MSAQTDDRVERIDSIPTDEELGIERIPLESTTGPQVTPSKVRMIRLYHFEDVVVESEP